MLLLYAMRFMKIIFFEKSIDIFSSYDILISVTVPVIDLKGDIAMIKHSRQREAIRENLMNRCDHPTAEAVYMDIKVTFPNISLGTVYRNLTLLSELGEIQKISTSAGPDRFDGNIKPHCHFQCRHCQGLSDIPVENLEEISAHVQKNFPGIIEGNTVQFFGLCPECIETE